MRQAAVHIIVGTLGPVVEKDKGLHLRLERQLHRGEAVHLQARHRVAEQQAAGAPSGV